MKRIKVKVYSNPREHLEQFLTAFKSHWYVEKLIEYANKPEVKHVVEFGIFQGQTLAAFLTADIERLDGYDTRAPDKLIAWFDQIEKKAKLTINQGNSLEVDIGSCDMLFLDTVHKYSHVKKELLLNGSKVAHYIAVHDTIMPRGQEKKVRHAVEEYAAENGWKVVEDITIKTGIMIIERVRNRYARVAEWQTRQV